MTHHQSHTSGQKLVPLTDDQFDELVDDATHAVNNLIPDRLLAALSASERSELLIAINDALTPILGAYFTDDL